MDLYHEGDHYLVEKRIVELRQRSQLRVKEYAAKNIGGHTDNMTIVLRTTFHLSLLMDSILDKFDKDYSYSVRREFDVKIRKMEELGFPEKIIKILKEFNVIRSKFRDDLTYQLQLPDINPFTGLMNERSSTIHDKLLEAYFFAANEMQAILDISNRLPMATAYLSSSAIPVIFNSDRNLVPEVSRQLSLISRMKQLNSGDNRS